MIGAPVRSAAETNPPRPNRCSLYRSLKGLPMPLKPSGHTPTSSPFDSSRSASALQARVWPALRAIGARNGAENAKSAPSIRRWRCAGWWSRIATAAITESSGIVPGVIGDHERMPGVGDVVEAARLHPEPALVQRAPDRREDVVGQVRVETEVVHLVLTGDPPPQERERAGKLALPVGRFCRGRRQVAHPPAARGGAGVSRGAAGSRRAPPRRRTRGLRRACRRWSMPRRPSRTPRVAWRPAAPHPTHPPPALPCSVE